MNARAEAYSSYQKKPMMSSQMVDPSIRASLEQGWLTIETRMVGLVDPPEQYQEAYLRLKEMHEAYVKLYQMAVDPSGTIDQYTYTIAILQQVIDGKYREFQQAYAVK